VNDGGGNHVGDALSDVAAVTLKCNADYLAVLHHRSAAVTRVDLGANLNRKVLIDRRMSVKLKVNSRHNPSSDRHSFPANGITVSRNR
jgi:hypothetical protein